MEKTLDEIKDEAFLARALYKGNQITREQARERIMPYINMYNEKVVEIAKKYNQKPKKISFITFLRG